MLLLHAGRILVDKAHQGIFVVTYRRIFRLTLGRIPEVSGEF